jgi:peptide/nickel transport system ATP-binding protein
MPAMPEPPVLQVDRLRVTFRSDDGPVVAVEDVSFAVSRGRTLGIVGESGSGKTVSSLAALGLLDPRQAQVDAQALTLQGRDLLGLAPRELQALRGDRMAVIWQDPMTALNPYLRIGDQLAEVLVLHRNMKKAQALQASAAMMTQVGIPAAKERLRAFPHELSGGMRQRVVIAMALLCQPDLVLADEPTTALDVTIQAQVLQLIRAQQQRTGLALVLVTHDMGVIAAMADEVLVMYSGLVVEQASAAELFAHPRHPYTVGLLASLPAARRPGEPLYAIAGLPPLPQDRPPGCVFQPRCALAIDACRQQRPEAVEISPGHTSRCLRTDQVPAWAATLGRKERASV